MDNVMLISTTDHYVTWIGALIWIGFLVMFAYCFVDVFRRHDLRGVA
jgi:membrane protein DedA with SNARE-associated domain